MTIDDENAALARGEVHVWAAHASTLDDELLQQHCRKLLTPEERDREGAFRQQPDRRLYLLSRALSRTVLSRYHPVDPQHWRFVQDKFGRPHVSDDQATRSLSFNISHSAGLVICAVAGRSIGVDTESVLRHDVSMELVDRYFATSEVDHLHATSLPLQNSLFLEYWTLKEAYIKARGEGLTVPLSSFAVDLRSAGSVRVGFDRSLDADPARWEFWLLGLRKSHLVAVCAEKEAGARPRQIRVRELVHFEGEQDVPFELLRVSQPSRDSIAVPQ